jgi:hypothetical protein
LVQTGHSPAIYLAWQEGHFTLMVCAEQLDELRATLRKPAIAARIKPYKAGRLVNQLTHLAEIVDPLPHNNPPLSVIPSGAEGPVVRPSRSRRPRGHHSPCEPEQRESRIYPHPPDGSG